MKLSMFSFGNPHAHARRFATRKSVECFEGRCVLSAVAPSVLEVIPNDTLDIAEDLGVLISGEAIRQTGSIGDSPAAPADVDWYSFTLEVPSRVALHIPDSTSRVCLGLYNTSPFTFEDLQTPLGHRLIAQSEYQPPFGDVRLEGDFAPGTYYVAVSGAGNHAFHPFLAGSGLPGDTGEYELVITSSADSTSSEFGPIVFRTEPVANSALDASPFVIRVSLSAALDPGTISADETVQFLFSTNSDFDDGDEWSVPLSMLSFSPEAAELQLTPAMPLAPGYYRVLLAGDVELWPMVLTDLNGAVLGADIQSPFGKDFSFEFQITGAEGRSADGDFGDDTPETAHELGDVTDAGLVEVSGAIGDDPYYDPNVDWLLNPANDVDMYHFQVSGPDRYAFIAEVFAGRIGSPLDPGISLFRVDPSDGSLQFVDGNNNTFNASLASDGTVPLFSDAALFAGLTEGDYYLAVSSGFNTPSTAEKQYLGLDGVFDPTMSHSGQAGSNTGNYRLAFRLQADSTAPEILETSLSDDATVTAPPKRLSVTFSEPVNVRQMAFQTFGETSQNIVPSVFVQATDGSRFYPLLESYDGESNAATFLMLTGLESGEYEWHFSGALGLTDLAGNAVVSNDVSGDFVVHFVVDAPSRGVNGDPRQWLVQEPNDEFTAPQDLGVLFPRELAEGVTVTRNAFDAAADEADFFRIELLQRQLYSLRLTGDSLPDGIVVSVFDAGGQEVAVQWSSGALAGQVKLDPGTYVVAVGTWSASEAANIGYELQLLSLRGFDNPPPLTGGPAPALQLRLAGTTPLPSTPPPVVVVTPDQGGNVAERDGSPIPTFNAIPSTSTSLLAFGEHLIGGIGGPFHSVTSPSFERVVLRLPNWFDIAGSREFALLTSGGNGNDSLEGTTNDSDEDSEASRTPKTPGESREATNDADASPKAASPTDVRSSETSTSPADETESQPPVETTPAKDAEQSGAMLEQPASLRAVFAQTAEQQIESSSIADASFAWLPALVEAVHAAFKRRDKELTPPHLESLNLGIAASRRNGKGAPTVVVNA